MQGKKVKIKILRKASGFNYLIRTTTDSLARRDRGVDLGKAGASETCVRNNCSPAGSCDVERDPEPCDVE